VILAVSLNPALDVTHHVAGADWAGVNRPHEVAIRPGGKAVNVARVLHGLGVDVLVTGMAGGPAGDELRSGLAAAGVPADFTPIGGHTRRTFAVVDTERGHTGLFNEPGPAISAAEYGRFRDRYRAALTGAAAVVLSGSLPRGLDAGCYAELAGLAADAGVPALLDTDGPALALGAAGRPAIIKPNLAELETSSGRSLRAAPPAPNDVVAAPTSLEQHERHNHAAAAGAAGSAERAADLDAVAQAAAELRAAGAGAVVVTLGAAGVLAETGDGGWLAKPPRPVSGNPTGAGDAVLAGLAHGLVLGLDWPQRLRRAVALGSAAAAAPVAGDVSQDLFRELAALVRVERRDR
jgi:tagatose 6-phosphate kinase